MIGVQEALEIVAEHLPEPMTEIVSLQESLGRRLAEEVAADRDNPAIDTSAMDGYAIASADGLRAWQVEAVAAAGDARKMLSGHGGCMEIMTGAPLPLGTDTVIPSEEVEREGRQVRLNQESRVERGRHVRHRGSNYGEGSRLLRSGERITAATLAVLASEGVVRVPVTRRLTAAILTSGSELVPPSEVPAAHQIRSSNLYAIEGELRGAGVEVAATAQCGDDPRRLRDTMEELSGVAEILLLTGGVSRGKYDLVEPLLRELGAEILFHWVAQKPGKPLLAARRQKNGHSSLILGLPGNPQAALIATRRYLLEAASRRHLPPSHAVRLPLSEPLSFAPAKTLFQPAALEETAAGIAARPVETTGSGDYYGLSRSDGFLELPAEQECFAAGELVRFYPWSGSTR